MEQLEIAAEWDIIAKRAAVLVRPVRQAPTGMTQAVLRRPIAMNAPRGITARVRPTYIRRIRAWQVSTAELEKVNQTRATKPVLEVRVLNEMCKSINLFDFK